MNTASNTARSSRAETPTILHGPVLGIARLAWTVVFVLTWVCFLAGLWINLRLAHVRSLEPLPGGPGSGFVVLLDVLVMITCTIVAGIIIRSKGNDWLGLFVSITFVTFGAATTNALPSVIGASPLWARLATFVMALGMGSILIFFYIFPNGRFVPRWTLPVSVLWTIWFLSWPFLPSLSPFAMAWPGGWTDWMASWPLDLHMLRADAPNPETLTLAIFIVVYASGLIAQGYRRRHISSPVERQQTKWATFGLTVAFIGFFLSNLFMALLTPRMDPQDNVSTALYMVFTLIQSWSVLLIPVATGISILRYRLWDIDPLINRTLVYGLVTAGLGAVLLFDIVVFQTLFRALLGKQSDIAVIASTLLIAALFQPVRRRMQNTIDRLFYREKVDFQQAFTNFSHEIRTIIDLPELSRVLTNRLTDLLHATYGAFFLQQSDGSFSQIEHYRAADLHPQTELPEVEKLESVERLVLSREAQIRLQAGLPVTHLDETSGFTLLVPLLAPRAGSTELVGVLAFGARRSGEAYSREDRTLLLSLADQAGTAIYVARLIAEKQAEEDRREEAERHLEAHRNSPVGRAEVAAQVILLHPETALAALHDMAEKASEDSDTLSLLSSLNQVLDERETEPIAHLAEGYTYLVNGLTTPEVLPLGLRTLIAQLEIPPASAWYGAQPLVFFYRLCRDAMGATNIAHITQALLKVYEEAPALMTTGAPQMFGTDQDDDLDRDVTEGYKKVFFGRLGKALLNLKGVAEALYAYERVDTAQDKLTYLVSAVERLSRLDRAARVDLGGADRAIILRTVEVWLGVVTGEMSQLQARAQLVCNLLTRHTWQDDLVTLVLSLRNEGRGTALNIRVSLAPSPEYSAVDEASVVAQLTPGEEAQIELRVRPRLTEGVDQFRARFVIQYADPRGPDQVENFADLVHLLTTTLEFRFIPNPYVVGTPLHGGSPLFFGRADVVAFIQENLSAAHRNNLVLIGQRRTGKTSLLKQLSARLGDEYLPVYVDGQALGLDPGMDGFFLTLATEISFAMEDRGFTPPPIPECCENPVSTFERSFLEPLHQAIGDRHLLILFDEFEELESAVRRGALDATVFNFLRHLIQHHQWISVIFCGTHRMEELASDYWNVLFNISLYRNIGFLEQTEAQRLIQEPVAQYGMRYDDLALDKDMARYGGHPYFLQLLCHSLVNRHNKTQRSYMTVADVNAALDEILASGEAHFVYLWTESTPEERLALTALSRTLPLTGHAMPVNVIDYLDERGIQVERRALREAMRKLVMRDILSTDNNSDAVAGETYRWRLGLIGLWVEKYKSLSRVADEVHA